MKNFLKKAVSMVVLTAMLLSVCLTNVDSAYAAGGTFSDVPVSHWGFQYIEEAYADGVVTGVGTDANGHKLYAPDEIVTEAEVLTIMARLCYPERLEENKTTISMYHKSYDWWLPASSVWQSEGMMSKTSITSSTMKNPMNRLRMADALGFILEDQGITIPDSDTLASVSQKIGDWDSYPKGLSSHIKKGVLLCYSFGILCGVNANGDYAGYDYLTRAGLAKIYCRMKAVINSSPKNGTASGDTTESVRATASTASGSFSSIEARIEDAISNLDDTVDLSGTKFDRDELAAYISTFEKPSYVSGFYVNGIGSYACSVGISYSCLVNARTVISEADYDQEELDSLAEEIVSGLISSGMTDYDKAKSIHDYIVFNTDYDYSYKVHDPVTLLKKGTGVCEAYARAFKALCDAAGLICYYVTGMTTRGAHAWNIVEIDGNFYHVDCTWDDPSSGVRYAYFLISDATISCDHTSIYDGAVPLCPSDYLTVGEVSAPSIPAAQSTTVDPVTGLKKYHISLREAVDYLGDGAFSIMALFPSYSVRINGSILNVYLSADEDDRIVEYDLDGIVRYQTYDGAYVHTMSFVMESDSDDVVMKGDTVKIKPHSSGNVSVYAIDECCESGRMLVAKIHFGD